MRRLTLALLLLAACSNPLGGATSDVRVTLDGVTARADLPGMATVRFTVTNTTRTEIMLGYCGGSTGASLEIFQNGHWSADPVPDCLPTPDPRPTLAGHASVTDSITAPLSTTAKYRVAVPYTVPGSERYARSPAFDSPATRL
jgi:hypothetical protein